MSADSRLLLHAQQLAALLRRRPDLVGVHPPADALAAATLWGV